MNKKIFILSLLIGLVGGGIFLFIIGEYKWILSWVCGVILGSCPFIFWQITHNILYKFTKYSVSNKINDNQAGMLSFRYYLLIVMLAFKFIILGLLILSISKLQFIIATPFLLGLAAMVPIIVMTLLIYRTEQNSQVNNKSILMFYGK
jgi:hypothetical protein